ncbi:MAG: hypothetical protein AAFN74_17275, partial [Myxococcota bacterium]
MLGGKGVTFGGLAALPVWSRPASTSSRESGDVPWTAVAVAVLVAVIDAVVRFAGGEPSVVWLYAGGAIVDPATKIAAVQRAALGTLSVTGSTPVLQSLLRNHVLQRDDSFGHAAEELGEPVQRRSKKGTRQVAAVDAQRVTGDECIDARRESLD